MTDLFPVLLSFAEPNIQSKLDKLSDLCADHCKLVLFVDSGAFTAAKQGITIDIDKYIAFLHKNHKIIRRYLTLDVIANPNQSQRNTEIIEAAGLRPWPVVHYGLNQYHIAMLVERYSKLAVGGPGWGGVTGHGMFSRMTLATIHQRNPQMRVHGLGLSNPNAVLSLPYTSGDSTSWLCNRFGDPRLWHPVHKKLYCFTRGNITGKTLPLLKETLTFYGLTANHYLRGEFMNKYKLAAAKSFLEFAKHVSVLRGKRFLLYLASMEVSLVKHCGFFSFMLHNMADGPCEHPMEKETYKPGANKGRRVITRKERGP